jgi:selenoprotein W-related protein
LAAELLEELGVRSDLVASGGGVFEVKVDGKLLYSKQSLGRFPEDGEVLGLIRAR